MSSITRSASAEVVNLQEYKVEQVMAEQRQFFLSNATREISFRREQLLKLRHLIKKYEDQIFEALRADLNKPKFEAYASEIGFLYEEIDHTLKHLKSWMKPQKVWTPLTIMFSKSFIISEPRGQVLIIGPWNYPFQLVIAPLVGAIAAGNCSVLKPSELAPQTSQLICDMIGKEFPRNFVAAYQGGIEVSQALLKQRFDHIFFTGGTEVGKVIARAAAEHLTPVTLELGGKSPCIVDETIDLEVAARRIVWGKFFNAGQTCVAPDYLLVQNSIKPKLLERMKHYIGEYFGQNPQESPDYCRIINERHFDRLKQLIDDNKVIAGGVTERQSRYIAPTVLDNVSLNDKCMQGEIFGPILPVLNYQRLDDAIGVVRQMPNPLAFYLFSTDKQAEKRLLKEVSFGGGCINNCLLHLGNPNLPFGGVGDSGIGGYHGKFSFDTFSHKKSIVKTSTWLDPKFIYQPYKDKLNLLKKFIK